MNMLVVDDDDMMAELVALHFSEAGYSIKVAGSGEAALAMMEASLPDVVLCDRRMPGMSGADLLEMVRSRDAAWQRVAFVFLTGLSDHRDRMSMLPLNPDGYLCKPLDFKRARVDVAAAIEHARARSAALQD
jgi:DNA-binding response OmpR family regulator